MESHSTFWLKSESANNNEKHDIYLDNCKSAALLLLGEMRLVERLKKGWKEVWSGFELRLDHCSFLGVQQLVDSLKTWR